MLFLVLSGSAQIDGDPDIGDLSAPGIFYDLFEETLDTDAWIVHNRIWGQPTFNDLYLHGGVIEENCYTENGNAVMRSLGDSYTGDLRSFDGQFSNRIGGAMYTKQRFASGRFEIKMKVIQQENRGVLSTAWLYWYDEITEDEYPVQYAKAVAAGNIEYTEGDETVVKLNSEIDIEVKGIGLSNPVLKQWIGPDEREQNIETSGGSTQLPINLNDDEYHVYRWDWHTGGNGEMPRVEYYIDNVLYRTLYEQVPYIAANFSVGNWFAWWAGNDTGTYNPPVFDEEHVYVDWVKITPFYEPNDDWFLNEGKAPYPNWVAHEIPGVINAVNYDRGGEGVSYHDDTPDNVGDGIRQDESVDTNTADPINGSVGWMKPGEWVEYTVYVNQSGLYNIDFYVTADNEASGIFSLAVDGTDVSGDIDAINTGSWTDFQVKTINDIALVKGQRVLRVSFIEGGFNWSQMDVRLATPILSQEPYPFTDTRHAIPGIISAINFDEGGEGISYHDSDEINRGNDNTRNTGVDVYDGDDGRGKIGYSATGEWLEYSVSVAQPGNYRVACRVSSNLANPGAFRLELDGEDVTGTVSALSTGGWAIFQELVINSVNLTEGDHILRFFYVEAGFDISEMAFTPEYESGQTPYPSILATRIPGGIRAVDYDNGGEGIAYYDGTPGNASGLTNTPGPRQDENVDTTLEDDAEDGGTPTIGWGSTGEWTEYTIHVTQPGMYFAEVRVASVFETPGTFRIEVDGEDKTGVVSAVTTGSYTNFEVVTVDNIDLTEGIHVLRFNIIQSGFNWSKLTLQQSATAARVSSNFSFHTSNEQLEEDHAMRIYHNPIQNKELSIHLDETIGSAFDLSILNLSGSIQSSVKVQSGSSLVDLSSLSAGVYFVFVTNQRNTFKSVERIVVP